MFRQRLIATTALLALIGVHSQVNAQILGSAGAFAVLAGSAVTNTGSTVLFGDLGVWPNNAITGFPPGIVNGSTHAGDGAANSAHGHLTAAYVHLRNLSSNFNLTGQDLGGMTLVAGVYTFDSSAQLTGPLVLNAQGDPDAQFVFQIGSTLTTASASSVSVINGGDGCNVYWQVGSSATLGTSTAFTGHIVALTSITLTTGATILEGSALARNGAVTLDTNLITQCAPVPEPASMIALGAGVAALVARRRRQK